MTGLDWIIVAVCSLLAIYGFGQGFVVGALSLLGFAGGAFLGSRVGPALLADGARSEYAPLFALLGAVLGGVLLAVGLEALGRTLRGVLRVPGLGLVDGVLGAALLAVAGLGLAWVFGAVALQTPGARQLRADVQRSSILRAVNDVLPPRTVLNALARFDPFPRVRGPAPAVSEPPSQARIARDPQVRAAAEGVVRLRGTACGLGVEGSGWVAAPETVVTNAHVIAGQDDTIVEVGGRPPDLPARAVAFDPANDIAVLRVPDLSARALPIARSTGAGTAGAVLGFPENGPYDVRAARLADTRTVLSEDAYGRGPLERTLVTFRGLVRSGNSGGPVVDEAGAVLTTVFAATVGKGPRGGYGVPNDVVRRALGRSDGAGRVGTGPCTAG